MIHILDLPGQGDPAHAAPGEVTYPDTCDLIFYRAWQPALEAMQSGREDGSDGAAKYVCMYFCIYIIVCPCFVY